MYYTESKIIEVLRDYKDSNDTLRTVAQRHGIKPGCVSNWAKKAGISMGRRQKDWGMIRKMLG